VAELGSLGEVCDRIDRVRRDLAVKQDPADLERRLRLPCSGP
jgi:hypothetical protein